MKKYRAAIVGLGNIGYQFQNVRVGFPTTHFEVYRDHPQIELVAVCDTDNARVQAFAQKENIPAYRDLDELFAKESPNVVSVCTPDATHAVIVDKLLRQKGIRGIWCEKPIALALADARRMVDGCAQKDVSLLVNFIRRYDPLYQQVKMQRDALLGDIQAVTCYASGGLVTTGSHMIDLLRFFFGECTSASAEKIPHGVVARLHFPHIGPVQLVSMDSTAYTVFELDMLGTNARLDLMNKPFGDYAYRYTVKEKSQLVPTHMLVGNEERPIDSRLPRNFMAQALEDLLACIESKDEPVSSGASALHSLEVLSAIWYSANQQGATVTLPLSNDITLDLPAPTGDVRVWKKS